MSESSKKLNVFCNISSLVLIFINFILLEDKLILLGPLAFKVKSKKEAINDLVAFSEKMNKKTREQQKQFLSYCSVVFQDSILHSYKIKNRENKYTNGLDLKKFAPFVHEENILDFYNEVQKGYEDIERNGNPRIIFLDISIKLTKLLHKKKTEHA